MKSSNKLYFHCGPLKKQNLGTIRIKTDAKSRKKRRPIILRLFENMNIKHCNIMNSRKTKRKLIENITAEVPNTASMSQVSCSMFLSFLKKWSFNFDLKLLIEFASFRSFGKLFQTIGVR